MCNLLIVFIVLCGGIMTTEGVTSWSSCSRPETESPITVTNFDISPKPLRLPGYAVINMQGHSTRTLGSAKLEISIVRQGWVNLPVPCLFNIGSCTYPDMCTLLRDMKDGDWLGITRDLSTDIQGMLDSNGINPNLCPQPAMEITLTNERIRVPEMPTLLWWFTAGDYRVNLRVVSNGEGSEELACIDLELALAPEEEETEEAECDGWFGCFF